MGPKKPFIIPLYHSWSIVHPEASLQLAIRARRSPKQKIHGIFCLIRPTQLSYGHQEEI